MLKTEMRRRQEQFIDRWREKAGCKNLGQTCWCTTCCALERTWDIEMKKTIAEMTAILQQRAQAQSPSPEQDVLREIISLLKQ